MAKEGPNWDGLLKWSLSHADGTQPPRNLRYPFEFHLSLLGVYDYKGVRFIGLRNP